MFKYLVNLCGWGDLKVCLSNVEFKKGDRVIVEDESGNILGTIKNPIETEVKRREGEEIFTILREATERDLKNFEKNAKKEKEILDLCRKESKRMELEMKFVDVFTTLGKGTIIITFIADGRVDFRQLVKNLSRIFHRSVRMRQIGSRDEARNLGGCGVCGKELCCVKFLGEIPSISTDMAKVQNVAQRGSDRISGICGRLMCCLSYEADQYREMLRGLPEVGSSVKTKKGAGEIIELNPLEQAVKVRLTTGEYVIIKKEELQ
ncbi:MAG: regulatory iron-sulfur-containing complex subunit RicT [Candidatus Moranbacteria bacterium]|jgi:cell fate regulator YaaT (PSP1 superfamily)|nr:regulatory iron-sulfur-containing complex subunit RicT [Candidatus Moranbacteria bacterium]